MGANLRPLAGLGGNMGKVRSSLRALLLAGSIAAVILPCPLGALLAQPIAAEQIDPKLIPNPDALTQAERGRADDLVDRALPFVVAGDFDRSLPLLSEARKLYDKAWPKEDYLDRPLLSDYDLRNAALALGKDQGAQAELMVRQALALDFEHGRDETYTAFSSMDADAVSALAIILYRVGKIKAATQSARLLAASSDYGLRENVGQALLNEVQRLAGSAAPAEAEAFARFAAEAVDVPAMAQDRLTAELAASLAGLIEQRGGVEEAAAVLKERSQIGTVEESHAAENEMDAMILQLFRDGQEDRARALLAQVSGSQADTLNIDAADRLDRLAGQVEAAEQEVRLRELALSIYERDLGDGDGRVGRAMSALAGTYAVLHRLDDAERMYRRALTRSQRLGGADSLGTIDDTRELASVLRRLARPEEAEALLRRIWGMTNLTGDFEESDYLRISIELTSTLLDQERIEEADRLTADIHARLADAAGLDEDIRVLHLTNRARVLNRLGRFAQVESLLNGAAALLPPAPNPRPGEIGDVDLYWGHREEIAANLALAYEGLGRFAEAEALRRPFFENFSLGGTQAADTIARGTDLATNLSHQGRNGEAEALYADLARAALDVFGAGSEQVAAVNRALALHLLRTGQFLRAREAAAVALAASAELQRRINPSAGESAYLARMRQQRSAAWLFARSAFAAGEPAAVSNALFEAFQRAEMTAAGAALARRAARDAAAAAGAGGEVRTWQAARSELASIDARIADLAQLGSVGDAERLRRLSLRENADRSLSEAERALADRYPRFFDLIASQPLPLAGFQGSQGLLRPDEALILLAPGSADLPEPHRKGLVLVVTREGSAVAEVALPAAELAQQVYILHQQLAAPGTGETDAAGVPAPTVRFERERAHSLYRALFGDPRIAQLLQEKNRWTLAPQGTLISLPFAALVTAPPPGGAAADADADELRATSWLGLQRTLAVIPSVPSIAIQRTVTAKPAETGRTPFFGLGDPAFRGVADPPAVEAQSEADQASRAPRAMTAYFRGAAADPEALAGLDRLPGTAKEIRTLAETLKAEPGSVLLQLDATEQELRRRSSAGSLRKADVVVFATHGLIGGELTSSVVEPALALTPPAAAGAAAQDPANDGLLTASEAAGLDLSADWLILSACNTAAGGSANSESLSGLARAFLFAGARSLLVSHFPIFDDAAPHLTGEAVRLAEAEALDPPAAMREAMRRLVANRSNDSIGYSFAHPKAWAPFAVIDAN